MPRKDRWEPPSEPTPADTARGRVIPLTGKEVPIPPVRPQYLTPECGPHCGYQANIGSKGGHEGHHVCPACHPTEKAATRAYRDNRK